MSAIHRMRRILLAAAMVVGMLTVFVSAMPIIVATHAVLGEMAEIVGGDEIDVATLIPSGFCPAHYDLAPSDLAAVAQAKLVIYSGFEPWMDTLCTAVGSEASILQLPGEWNTPHTATVKLNAIEDQLSLLLPEAAAGFASRAQSYRSELEQLDVELTARAAELGSGDIHVICIAWQAELVEWLGFEVAATYSRPEDLSLRDLVNLAEAGREAEVSLVVDNLQSGVQFGAKLAREIEAIHVVLSNFPGAMPHTRTFLDLLRANADALFTAISPLS